jgi:hypothetical protein
MIKVTYKNFPRYSTDLDKKTEIFKVLSFIYSEKDGYVAICRRLYDRTNLVQKQLPQNGGRVTLEREVDEAGYVVVIKLENLRVISDPKEEEREKHLRDLQSLLFKKEVV